MATLILNAGTASPISVTCQRAGKASPRFVGTKSLSFSGRERTSIRGQAKVIPIVASYVSTADEAAIQAAVMNGVQIPCSGDILGNIQTLCSIDSVVSNMVPGLVDFWEMSFTVNEVNASTVLFKYAPGDIITGEVFTRSTVAYQQNGNIADPLTAVGIDVKRDSHYINSVRSTLLEAARTNVVIQCRLLSTAAWTKTNMTATGTSTGADGALTSATRLTATAGNGTVLQAIVLASSARFQTAWVKRITGSGTIQMTMDNGATWTTIVTTAAYSRVSIPTQTLANPTVGFRIVSNGDAIDVDFVQNENGTFASSEIATAAVAVTRGADSYSFPFTTPPWEMTVYPKFIEKGSALLSAHLFSITSAAGASPLFRALTSVGFYVALHTNAASVSSQVAVAALEDVVELPMHLFGDGSVDIAKSVNGGASIAGVQSGATALATAWADDILWLNASGSSTDGFIALQSLKAVAGSRSLKETQAA